MYAATDRYFPLIVSALWGDVTLEDVATMERVNAPMRERGMRVSIADCRRAKMPTAPVRAALRTMIEQSEESTAKTMVATAVIIDSALLVAAMRGIFWLRPPVRPLQPFNDASSGMAFLQQQAGPANLKLPADAAAFVKRLDEAHAKNVDFGALFR